ncbi:hypothetical protein [Tumidithrix helvetica]|uniref:hypothetical protein n=1 Tax=Tumidithrix helvetica TaxID=3457545 RepID=UPI003CC63015
MVSDRIAITSGLASGCYFLLQQKGIGFFLPISGAPNGKAELQTSDTKAVALFNEGVRKEKEKNYLGAVEHQKWWGNGFI